MKTKIITLFILLIVVFSIIPSLVFGGEFIKALPDQAYQRSLEVVLDFGGFPKNTNDKLYYFTTEPLIQALTSKECDCGSFLGIPYMKDSRTVTEVIYKVRVRAVQGGSELHVEVLIIGYYDEKKNKITAIFSDKKRLKTKQLDCVSTGLIEKKFINLIKLKFKEI